MKTTSLYRYIPGKPYLQRRVVSAKTAKSARALRRALAAYCRKGTPQETTGYIEYGDSRATPDEAAIWAVQDEDRERRREQDAFLAELSRGPQCPPYMA